MRQICCRPSDPMVSYPGAGWQSTISPGSSSSCRYAATKSQRRIFMPSDAASDTKARREVPRMAAQNINRTRLRPGGKLRCIDDGPAAVAFVIVDFGPFGFKPGRRVRGHCLFARLGGLGKHCAGEDHKAQLMGFVTIILRTACAQAASLALHHFRPFYKRACHVAKTQLGTLAFTENDCTSLKEFPQRKRDCAFATQERGLNAYASHLAALHFLLDWGR
eukprot:4638572-Pleurochrysis_carterae.AAC.3